MLISNDDFTISMVTCPTCLTNTLKIFQESDLKTCPTLVSGVTSPWATRLLRVLSRPQFTSASQVLSFQARRFSRFAGAELSPLAQSGIFQFSVPCVSAARQLIRIHVFGFVALFHPAQAGFHVLFAAHSPRCITFATWALIALPSALRFLACCNSSIGSFRRSILAGSNFPPCRSGGFRYSSVNPRFSLQTVEYTILSTRSRHSCTVVGSFVRFPVRPIFNLSLLLISRRTSFLEEFASVFHSDADPVPFQSRSARIRVYSYLLQFSVALAVSSLFAINRSASFLHLIIAVSHGLRKHPSGAGRVQHWSPFLEDCLIFRNFCGSSCIIFYNVWNLCSSCCIFFYNFLKFYVAVVA